MKLNHAIAIAVVSVIALPTLTYAKGGSRSGGNHTSARSGSSGGGSHAVRGHTTKKGTYVAPTRATNPNRTQRDNYSSKPNTNPYNGKQGKRNPSR